MRERERRLESTRRKGVMKGWRKVLARQGSFKEKGPESRRREMSKAQREGQWKRGNFGNTSKCEKRPGKCRWFARDFPCLYSSHHQGANPRGQWLLIQKGRLKPWFVSPKRDQSETVEATGTPNRSLHFTSPLV